MAPPRRGRSPLLDRILASARGKAFERETVLSAYGSAGSEALTKGVASGRVREVRAGWFVEVR